MKTCKVIFCLVFATFYIVCWRCEPVRSQVIYRLLNIRYAGERSGITRIFRSSRAAIASRYSYQWKMRAPSRGYIFVHPTLSDQQYYASKSYIDTWAVCFNLIFSGEKNSPVVPINSHYDLRYLNDSVYELALNRILNVTIQNGVIDAEFYNYTGPLELAPLADEADLKENSSDSNTWQYMGLFACPMFQGSKYITSENDCCGPEDAEYCCQKDIDPDVFIRIGASVSFVTLLLVLGYFRKKIFWFIMGFFGEHETPRLPPVNVTEGQLSGGAMQPEQVPLNVVPPLPSKQPDTAGNDYPEVPPPNYEFVTANNPPSSSIA